VTAEFDPLRDEGEAYGQRLRLAGISVKTLRFGAFHGFFFLSPILDLARHAVTETCRAVREQIAAI
jgi:acetyl esterase